jgi:iron complex outermembrane receptor protein
MALCASAAFLAAPAAPVAVAQSDQAVASGAGLEEIVVTARRKEERVQTIPLAITAFSQNQLDQQRVLTLTDLSRSVPSLAISVSQSDLNAPYSGQVRLRGLPGSVVYFADVPLGNVDYNSATGLTHANTGGFFYDLDNLEVLKGPQGTLFGKNSIGGLISLEPKLPTNDYEGYAEVKFGDYNDKEFEGAVNIPIVQDKLLVRIAGQTQQRDGYTKDYYTGKDYDNKDQYSWRVSVTARPTDDLQDTFIYDSYLQHTNGSSAILSYVNPDHILTFLGPGFKVDPTPTPANPCIATVTLGGPAFAVGTPPGGCGTLRAAAFPTLEKYFALQQSLGVRTQAGYSDQPIGKDYFYGFTNTTTWDITDDLTVKNIAAARVFKQEASTDDAGISLPILNIGDPYGYSGGWGDDSVQYTEEFQLQGKAIQDKLSWVAGAFLEFDHPLGETSLPSTAVSNTSYYHFHNSDRSQAVFAHGIYDLGDYVNGLRFTAGYRYTWDFVSVQEKGYNGVDHVTRDATGAATNCAPIGYDNNCAAGSNARFSSFGWNLSLDEQLDSSTLLYVRSGNAYRPGGTNPQVPLQFQSLKPEHVTDVELGAKVDWDIEGMKLRTNGDIFHTDYKAIQVQQLVNVTDSQGNTHAASLETNAASAQLEGAEAEVTVIPIPSVELGGHGSYLYSHYDEYPAVFGAGNTKPPFFYEPKFQFGVTGTYHLPLDESIGDVSVTAAYSWYGHQYVTATIGEPYNIMPSYDQLDLNVNWTDVMSYPVDVGFFMTNALDTTHVQGVFPIYVPLGFTSLVYNEPRMFGFSVKYRFSPTSAPEEAPAAYTPPPAVAPSPAPVARSYMVFFDFNKSDLTPEAVSIVDQAARNAAPAKATTLTVTGHTDTVGSDAYNMRLSKRRAESVAAELEKDGIASSEITIVAKGKRDLLVPTEDGVREPQNRRVTIVYDGGPTS